MSLHCPPESPVCYKVGVKGDTSRKGDLETHPQQECELGVAIVHMPGLAMSDVHQSHDNVAKSAERFVDATCLLRGEEMSAEWE